MEINDRISIHDLTKAKTKHDDRQPGERAEDVEVTSGQAYHRDTETWRTVWQRVAHREDRYQEPTIGAGGNSVFDNEPLRE